MKLEIRGWLYGEERLEYILKKLGINFTYTEDHIEGEKITDYKTGLFQNIVVDSATMKLLLLKWPNILPGAFAIVKKDGVVLPKKRQIYWEHMTAEEYFEKNPL